MTAAIVTSRAAVTLVGGGPFEPAALEAALTLAPRLVAADSGALKVIALGRRPEAVIGDMDSLPESRRAGLPGDIIHPVPEQDSTDFEKCLTRITAPLTLAVGFTGGRTDHELAVFSVLARHPDRRCVVLGARDAIVLAPPALDLGLAAGTRVSLFPLGPVAGASEGLHWPIRGIGFDPLGRIGTSNRATGPVRLSFDAPRMLVILPLERLDLLLDGLARAPVWAG